MTEAPKDLRKNLIKALKDEPMSVSELARKFNVGREFMSGYLEALRDVGNMKLVKVGRSNVYKPK